MSTTSIPPIHEPPLTFFQARSKEGLIRTRLTQKQNVVVDNEMKVYGMQVETS